MSTETPFSDSGPVPCANGGAGDQVDLSGSLHELFHVTVDDSGAVHVTSHDNPQGINGVGETTGAKYQATGVTEDHENQGSGGLPVTFTYVNNFRVIGQGPGNNFLFHENMHVTINAAPSPPLQTTPALHVCSLTPPAATPARSTPAAENTTGTTLPVYYMRAVGLLSAARELVLQQYFVICFLSSLVVAGFRLVQVASSPGGPVPCGSAGRDLGGQVCQETADLAERDRDEAAAHD